MLLNIPRDNLNNVIEYLHLRDKSNLFITNRFFTAVLGPELFQEFPLYCLKRYEEFIKQMSNTNSIMEIQRQFSKQVHDIEETGIRFQQQILKEFVFSQPTLTAAFLSIAQRFNLEKVQDQVITCESFMYYTLQRLNQRQLLRHIQNYIQ
jgi:hypothetical protein